MKANYPGLATRRMAVTCQPLLQASMQKIKAKTKVNDWKTEEVDLEMGISDMTISDTPIAP